MPDTIFIFVFLTLFGFQVYCLANLFSYIDSDLFSKYRLLGPFALLIPGVLKPGGRFFLLVFLLATTSLLLAGMLFFEFDEASIY
ncbi:hypothetical protein N9241_00570 [bacterium]|nr:hypothetical protein [bacterium]